MTTSSVEKAVSGLMFMMELTVTGVEELILFVIHMLTSTYLCLMGDATQTINKGINEIFEKIPGLPTVIDFQKPSIELEKSTK